LLNSFRLCWEMLGIWSDRSREFAKERRERGIQEAQRNQEEQEEGKELRD
jgi:hypothetical protein